MTIIAVAIVVVALIIALAAMLWARAVSVRSTHDAISKVAKAVEASIIVEIEQKRLDIAKATDKKTDDVDGMSKDELEREINK